MSHDVTCPDECPCSQMICLMHDISEREWCAGWYMGVELILWRELQAYLRSGGRTGAASRDELKNLQKWSEGCGGWAHWPDIDGDHDGARWISLDDWKRKVDGK